MINAKDKFREGFIMLLRPFKFAELQEPLQKLTILWAYSEQAIIKRVLTEEGQTKIEDIKNQSNPFNLTPYEEWLEQEIAYVTSKEKYFRDDYKGEIVQCVVDKQICRFYPDEYKILSSKKLQEALEEEGYHCIIDERLRSISEFKNKVFYLTSRGVPERIAEKWVSVAYKDLVIYKPYYELLDMFCRPNEIIADDPFYVKTENIDFTELKNIQKDYKPLINIYDTII